MKLLTNWTTKRIRKGAKMFGGMNALVLTTVGRKNSARRSTPVGYFPDQDGGWLMVASAAGAPKNPAWYHNIAAHPDTVYIETGGRNVAVVAEQLHGAERDRAWKQITTAAGRFAQYQQKADRLLPIIRLTPRTPDWGEKETRP
jgi:deazaflavin-dependent oxidoreductase (nitroreductase family)